MEVSHERMLTVVFADILRPRRFEYLYTLWRELCTAFWRTEISRQRGWLHHGIPLLRRAGQQKDLRPLHYNYALARMNGIRRLLSIHPKATRFDLQVLCLVIRRGLFEEGHHMAEEGSQSNSRRIDTEQ